MCSQVFLTNSANVFLLEPCQDVPKLLENQLEVCRAVLSVYRHIIMEQNMNRQTWSVTHDTTLNLSRALLCFTSCSQTFSLLCASYYSREQLLQVLLRITEAVMKRPQENQRKDAFSHSLASILFKVSTNEQHHRVFPGSKWGRGGTILMCTHIVPCLQLAEANTIYKQRI